MSHSDDEEFDRRFQALIRAEFGDVAGAGPPGEPAAPPKADRPQSRRFGARKLKDPIEYFNLSKAIEQATPDDDHERWRPPVESSWGRPRLKVIIGVALLVTTLLTGILVLAGLRPGVWLAVLTALAACLGLALLFSALPRHCDPTNGDGARL